MKCWFSIPIRVQLIIIVAIVAIPAAIVIVYTEIQFKDRELEHARIDTRNIVETVSSEQQVLMASVQQVLTILAQLPEINEKDSRGTSLFLYKILKLHPNLLNIFVADRNGLIWASGIPNPRNIMISDRRYFKNAIATGQISSGCYQVGRISHRPSLNIAFPYRDSNSNIAGVIVVGIDLNEYTDVLRLAQITDGSNLVLIDYSGTTLFSVMDRESMVGKPYDSGLFRRMQSGADIDTLTFNSDDASKTRYLSYRKLYLNGEQEPYMYVLVTVPARPIIIEVNKQIVMKMNQLLLVLISALFLSWFVAEKAIADRIRLLKDASRKLAEGDDQVRISHVVKGGELGTLGEAFDHMAQQLLLRKNALLQREADLKKAQELAKLGSWNLDSSGALTWSFEMFRIFGVSPDSYTPSTQNFLELVHPDDRPAMKAWIQACEAGECNGELQFRTILPDGTIKHISGCGELTYNSEGKWARMSGTAQDITDRKRAENTIIEKQYELEQLNKDLEARISDAVTELRKKDNILMLQSRQAAMGETIGNIAHQWRQPLNALGLIVQELKMTYGHEDFTRESLNANVDKAMQLILHMSKTIDDFQHFFKPNIDKNRFSINKAVANTVSLIASSLEKMEINVKIIEKDLVEIDGYGNEYGQVLLNLLNNSRDAFEGKDLESKQITISISQENGRSVVTVADNAGGIPEDVVDKIFDPYFTTKGPDKGTGIGLYMAKNIIEKHMEGKLTVHNSEVGAEFRIEV